MNGVSDRANGESLRQAGNAFKQHVTVAEKPHQNSLKHLPLAHNNFTDLVEKTVDELALLFDLLVQSQNVDATSAAGSCLTGLTGCGHAFSSLKVSIPIMVA